MNLCVQCRPSTSIASQGWLPRSSPHSKHAGVPSASYLGSIHTDNPIAVSRAVIEVGNSYSLLACGDPVLLRAGVNLEDMGSGGEDGLFSGIGRDRRNGCMSLWKMKCPGSPDLTRQCKANFSSSCYTDCVTHFFLQPLISRKGCLHAHFLSPSTHFPKHHKPHTASFPPAAPCCELWSCLEPGLLCGGTNDATKTKAQCHSWSTNVSILRTAPYCGCAWKIHQMQMQLICLGSKGGGRNRPMALPVLCRVPGLR